MCRSSGASVVGQCTNLANHVLVASVVPGIAGGLRRAGGAGGEAGRSPEAWQGGFADSKPLQVFGPRMASRSYEPALGTVNVMLKDLLNAVAVSEEAGVPLPMARAAVERFKLLVAEGKGEAEPSAFIDLLARGK